MIFVIIFAVLLLLFLSAIIVSLRIPQSIPRQIELTRMEDSHEIEPVYRSCLEILSHQFLLISTFSLVAVIWLIINSDAISPETRVIVANLFELLVVGATLVIASIIAVHAIRTVFEIPSGLRKVIAVLTAITVVVICLSVLSNILEWGWNIPDAFGIVAGALTLTLTLWDRYVAMH